MATNTLDDMLLNMLKTEFSTDEQQQFLDHFSMYLRFDAFSNDFVIDLDDVFEWAGFILKQHAKRSLVKNFVQEVDYIIENLLTTNGEQSHGGHNKEKIMMSIQTFKSFCMMANTEKGKKTRMYYVKMERIFFKYMQDKQIAVVQELEENAAKREERLKHETLLATVDKKRVIYLTRVKTFEDGKFIIKLGWTNGLADRNRSHAVHFGSSLLLDVFECQQNSEFELFLKRHPQVKKYAYTEPIINDVKSSETYQVTQHEYQSIINIIKKNIKFYQGLSQEAILEIERLNFQNKLLEFLKEKDISNENIPLILDYMKSVTPGILPETAEDDMKNKEVQMPVGRTGATRKVQKYDPLTLTLISTYTGIMDVLRTYPNMSKFGIKQAALNNTIYNGYRWFFIDIDAENKQYEIPPTKEIKSSIPRFVAMMDKEKQRIEKVFASQEEAMKGINITRKQTINDLIKTGRVYKNTACFQFYNDCSEEQKKDYLGRDQLPSILVAKGTQVYQIDIKTKEIIETFPSISAVLKKVCISRESLKRACETKEPHAGYLWEIHS